MEDFGEAEEFDDFVDAVGDTEEFEVAFVFTGEFGEADEGAETGAADVVELAAIEKDAITVLLEEAVELGLQAGEGVHVERALEVDKLDVASGFLFDMEVFHRCSFGG